MTLFVYLAAFWAIVGGAAASVLLSPWYLAAVVAGVLVAGYAAHLTVRGRL